MAQSNVPDLTEVSQPYEDLYRGPPQDFDLTLGGLADRIMRNSATLESMIIDLVTGRLYPFTGHTTITAIFTAVNANIVETFDVPEAYDEKRTIEWDVDGRTRDITNSGGTAGVSDVLDPALPLATFPTLMNRIEDGAVAGGIVVSQLNPVPVIAGNGGVWAITTAGVAAAVAELDAPPGSEEYFLISRTASAALDQIFE